MKCPSHTNFLDQEIYDMFRPDNDSLTSTDVNQFLLTSETIFFIGSTHTDATFCQQTSKNWEPLH